MFNLGPEFRGACSQLTEDAGSLRPVWTGRKGVQCAARQPHLCILSLTAVTQLTGKNWGASGELAVSREHCTS